jgi:hypothetical protein
MAGVKSVPGRTLGRTWQLCAGCGGRVAIGEPKAGENWPARLELSREQIADLLVAAAEYRDLTAAAGEYESAVDFVDWMSVDALRSVA